MPAAVTGASTISASTPRSMVCATRRQAGLSVTGRMTFFLRFALTASTSASPRAVAPSYMLALATGNPVRRLM